MKNVSENISDQLLVSALNKGSHEAFDIIFRKYYKELVFFASTFIDIQADCEDIVQEVFARIWTRREILTITQSIRAYLYRLVKDKCIDTLRHRKVKQDYHNDLKLEMLSLSPEDYIECKELSKAIKTVVGDMPAELRTVLFMSRHENLKIKEIAQKMDISTRTVEYRLSKALNFINERLRHLLPAVDIIGFQYYQHYQTHS